MTTTRCRTKSATNPEGNALESSETPDLHLHRVQSRNATFLDPKINLKPIQRPREGRSRPFGCLVALFKSDAK